MPVPEFGAERPVPEIANAASHSARLLLLSGLRLERANGQVHCRVQLTRDDRDFHGEASEMDSPTGRARAAARATLAAAEQAAGGVSLGLEGVAVIDLFSRKYVVVSVEAAQNRQFVLLAGMVTLESSRTVEDSAVLATLRAIERWIGA